MGNPWDEDLESRAKHIRQSVKADSKRRQESARRAAAIREACGPSLLERFDEEQRRMRDPDG
jgi:hypothetical protein